MFSMLLIIIPYSLFISHSLNKRIKHAVVFILYIINCNLYNQKSMTLSKMIIVSVSSLQKVRDVYTNVVYVSEKVQQSSTTTLIFEEILHRNNSV